MPHEDMPREMRPSNRNLIRKRKRRIQLGYTVMDGYALLKYGALCLCNCQSIKLGVLIILQFIKRTSGLRSPEICYAGTIPVVEHVVFIHTMDYIK